MSSSLSPAARRSSPAEDSQSYNKSISRMHSYSMSQNEGSAAAQSSNPASSLSPRAATSASGSASITSSIPTADADKIRQIMQQFKINSMTMANGNKTSEILWTADSDEWHRALQTGQEIRVNLPKRLLSMKAIARSLNFTSGSQIGNFVLHQHVYLHSDLIEDWRFEFGFVIPQSTNTWESRIKAAEDQKVLPPEVLNGNLVIETDFLDDDLLLARVRMRVWYV